MARPFQACHVALKSNGRLVVVFAHKQPDAWETLVSAMIKAGFVDWIVSTGAILYHDMHFALNYPIRVGSFKFDDTELRENDIVRVYEELLE